MVAVLTVFANHLCNWPRGGFVGVDVFFVISGFLITGNLLRNAEASGNVQFGKFYWHRVRRIIPAATVVLILTYLAATLVFLPFRAHRVGVDALYAFIFMSNWRFAVQGTDYFAQGTAVSPLQHYWSLSIEEQFYFVWPALIFIIGVVMVRRSWPHARRMAIASIVMTPIIAASLAWAIDETMTRPTWAYFDTFARVWELGVGALLATVVGLLARIPTGIKPILSWLGLLAIGASLFLLHAGSAGFPAPWAVLPVLGAAMVIAAGVNGEPKYQEFLRNPISTYVGDFSYSLYLVHWPVIVIVGALMDRTPYFHLTVIALSFGLAIASYHFVENPFRRADWATFRSTLHEIRRRRYRVLTSSKVAAAGAVALITVAVICFAVRPDAHRVSIPPAIAAATTNGTDLSATEPELGPQARALHAEIVAALEAKDWPQFDPPADTLLDGPLAPPEIDRCAGTDFPGDQCTWGSPTAQTRIVLIGDSIAATYAGPLRDIALNSNGALQVHAEVLYGCPFVNAVIPNEDERLASACPARKQHAIDFINATKPDVVIMAHVYFATDRALEGSDQEMTPKKWSDSMSEFIQKFSGSIHKVVLMPPPPGDPGDVTISDCYSKRSSTPADCINKIGSQWESMAMTEQDLAKSLGGMWIDSRPWFCSNSALCPSFVGSTLTKRDFAHMTVPYGQKITPVIDESLQAAGVY